jgi:cytochrome c553
MDGNSLNGKIAPKIAAQNAQYLTTQLNKFKDGIRKNAPYARYSGKSIC